MALKTQVGGRDSDSFITVTEADAYLSSGPDDITAWNNLSVAEKELRLKLSAQAIGLLRCRGRQIYCGQALAFPRSCQDVSHSIPEEVKEAQAWIAYSVIHRGLANRPTDITEDVSGSEVSQVMLGGLLMVSFRGSPLSGGSDFERLVRSANFPVYMKLKRWITQVRGGSVMATDDDDYPTCSTTTTTTSTTTTTTTSTTITT